MGGIGDEIKRGNRINILRGREIEGRNREIGKNREWNRGNWGDKKRSKGIGAQYCDIGKIGEWCKGNA